MPLLHPGNVPDQGFYSPAGLINQFSLVVREEFTKLLPVLILHRSILRFGGSNHRDWMAAGFFSGLVFGFFENIATSGAYNPTGGDPIFVTHQILSRVMFMPIFHACLGAISAAVLYSALKRWPWPVSLVCALGIPCLFHFSHNALPVSEFWNAVAFILVFGILYVRPERESGRRNGDDTARISLHPIQPEGRKRLEFCP